MNIQDKTKEEFISELKELQEAYDSLKVSIKTDLHSHEHTEKALLKSREMLKSIEQAAKIGGWEFDVESMNQTWTEEVFHILEIDTTNGAPNVPEGIGFIAPEYQSIALRGIQRAIEFGEPYNQEWEVITVKGNRRWINAIATPNQENGKTKSVSGSFQDITNRKLAEIALLESEENLSTTLHSIGDGVISTDKNGLVIQMNPVAEQLCGWQLAEAAGKPLTDIFNIINAETRLIVDDPVNKVLEQGEIVGLANHTVLVSRNGTEFQIADSAAPIINKEGGITGVVLVFSDVTEKYSAEKQIKDSEERYRMLLNNLEAGIVVHAPDTSIVMNNQRASELLGLSNDQMRGKVAIDPAWKFIHEDNTPLTLDEYPVNRIVNGRQPIKNQVLGIHQPGKNNVVWVTVNGFPVLDTKVEITEVVISFIDITEHKQFELLLQEKTEEIEAQNEEYQQINEELLQTNQEIAVAKKNAEINAARLKMAMEVSKSGAWDWDILENTFHWSDEFLQLFGFPENTIAGFEAWTKALHPDDVEKASAKIQEAIENHTELLNDYRIILPNKEIRWIRATGNAIYLNNKPARMIGLCMDITRQKTAEQELHHAKERAEANEEKYRLSEIDMQVAQQLAHIGSWHWDLITGLVTWSNELYNINGHNPDIPVPVFADMASFYTADSWKAINEAVAKTFKTGEPYNLDLEMLKPDGTLIFTNTRGCANYNEAGEMVNLHGTVQDISERKKAEEALIAAMERAQESDRLKSAFLANMSHEIRTPMNGILGFASLLKEPDLTGEDQQKYIHIIEKSGARMLKIINDIVDISKIEAGLMEVNLKESNINDQLEYIYNFFKPEIEGKGIRLSFKNSLPDKEAFIKTDREKVYAILTNLVKNAIKYTNGGSIEFGYEKNGEYLEFFVKDTGIGIAERRQEVIFERFIQADIEDPRALQGAGLGLAISKAYVEMLGGKISVKSEEGIGSTFYFTIPYKAKNQGKSDIEQVVFAEDSDVQMKKLKILIVEDDETSDFLISLMLKNNSHEVFHARTGTEAIEVSSKNPDIDLILMDIRMPNINGYDATTKIRQFNHEVIIIAQTAYGLLGDQQKALDAGCNEYLSKPIKKDELMRLLQKYFQRW
ncbi:MAG: PAS domain S-box protein [Bacteroidota bacterium]